MSRKFNGAATPLLGAREVNDRPMLYSTVIDGEVTGVID